MTRTGSRMMAASPSRTPTPTTTRSEPGRPRTGWTRTARTTTGTPTLWSRTASTTCPDLPGRGRTHDAGGVRVSAPTAGLHTGYDLVIFDLDGVVYLVDHPIPVRPTRSHGCTGRGQRRGVRDQQRLPARRRGGRAADRAWASPARPSRGAHLGAGVGGAARRAVAGRRPGAGGRRRRVARRGRGVGLRPVASADERPARWCRGTGRRSAGPNWPRRRWRSGPGAMWVATNTDRTLPSPRGPLPGNGSLVAALRTALDREPDLVVGKPEPALFETAAAQRGRPAAARGRRPARHRHRGRAPGRHGQPAGADRRQRRRRPAGRAAGRRPTYLATDLAGLFERTVRYAYRSFRMAPVRAEAGGWRVTGSGAGVD